MLGMHRYHFLRTEYEYRYFFLVLADTDAYTFINFSLSLFFLVMLQFSKHNTVRLMKVGQLLYYYSNEKSNNFYVLVTNLKNKNFSVQ